jgi:diaminopimelate epimerase
MPARSGNWLKFTKMHALGNDFVVIDGLSQQVQMTPARARKIADRHTGVGCDQILIVEPPARPDLDFGYRIFNQDGSEVAQCGNGARCFARFVRDRHLTNKSHIRVNTLDGEMELEVIEGNQRDYRAAIAVPRFDPADVPLRDWPQPAADGSYTLDLGGELVRFYALSVGNPHAVLVVPSARNAEVDRLGPLLQGQPLFPESVNVGFMEILEPQQIVLRVYERGAGETLACGSGACAAAIAGIRAGLLQSPVTVNLPLGKLLVEWDGAGQPVHLTGPASNVFQGRIRV